MTIEQAIQLLHRLSDEQFDGEYGDERREALSMAVRALFSQQIVNDSQGLVNDCISRKMAIDEVKRLHDVAWANWKETRISANTMIDALKDLPSAQPHWIPCSERLPEHPENDDYYLVTIQCEHYDGWDDYVTGFAEWTKHGWDELSCYIGQIKVIAWMPLPDPYGGEDE